MEFWSSASPNYSGCGVGTIGLRPALIPFLHKQGQPLMTHDPPTIYSRLTPSLFGSFSSHSHRLWLGCYVVDVVHIHIVDVCPSIKQREAFEVCCFIFTCQYALIVNAAWSSLDCSILRRRVANWRGRDSGRRGWRVFRGGW